MFFLTPRSNCCCGCSKNTHKNLLKISGSHLSIIIIIFGQTKSTMSESSIKPHWNHQKNLLTIQKNLLKSPHRPPPRFFPTMRLPRPNPEQKPEPEQQPEPRPRPKTMPKPRPKQAQAKAKAKRAIPRPSKPEPRPEQEPEH